MVELEVVEVAVEVAELDEVVELDEVAELEMETLVIDEVAERLSKVPGCILKSPVVAANTYVFAELGTNISREYASLGGAFAGIFQRKLPVLVTLAKVTHVDTLSHSVPLKIVSTGILLLKSSMPRNWYMEGVQRIL